MNVSFSDDVQPTPLEVLLIAVFRLKSTDGRYYIELYRPKSSEIYYIWETELEKYNIVLGDFCYASIINQQINFLKKATHNDGIVFKVDSSGEIYTTEVVGEFSFGGQNASFFTTKAFGRVAVLYPPKNLNCGSYLLNIRPLKQTEKDGKLKNYKWICYEYKLQENEAKLAFVISVDKNYEEPGWNYLTLWLIVEHETAIFEFNELHSHLKPGNFVQAKFRTNIDKSIHKFRCVSILNIQQSPMKVRWFSNGVEAEVLVYLFNPPKDGQIYPTTYHPKFGEIIDKMCLLPPSAARTNRITIQNQKINNKTAWVVTKCKTI